MNCPYAVRNREPIVFRGRGDPSGRPYVVT